MPLVRTRAKSAPRAAPAAPIPVPAGPKSAEELPVVEEMDLESCSDEDLMKLCQEGDDGGFDVLFRRYEGPALSFISRMVGDRGRVEALGQEAFLRIFKEARSYQYPRSFSTWFYTIVRNLCKNELRWRSRHPTVSLEESYGGGHGHDDDEAGHLGDSLSAEADDPLDKIVNKELLGRLQEALALLPAAEYELMILKLFQGLKYKEIAEVVGLPVGTVRGRIYAALERLRKSIKKYL